MLDYTQYEPMELPSPIPSHTGSVSTHHENSLEKENGLGCYSDN